MSFLDTHVHFWDMNRHEYPNYATEPSFAWPGRDEAALQRNFGPDDVVQQMAEAGVKGILFVQVINDSPEEAKWVAGLAKRHDIIKVTG
jgi:predicted TIM-barrel fold metal-dependent hydrolase